MRFQKPVMMRMHGVPDLDIFDHLDIGNCRAGEINCNPCNVYIKQPTGGARRQRAPSFARQKVTCGQSWAPRFTGSAPE